MSIVFSFRLKCLCGDSHVGLGSLRRRSLFWEVFVKRKQFGSHKRSGQPPHTQVQGCASAKSSAGAVEKGEQTDSASGTSGGQGRQRLLWDSALAIGTFATGVGPLRHEHLAKASAAAPLLNRSLLSSSTTTKSKASDLGVYYIKLFTAIGFKTKIQMKWNIQQKHWKHCYVLPQLSKHGHIVRNTGFVQIFVFHSFVIFGARSVCTAPHCCSCWGH